MIDKTSVKMLKYIKKHANVSLDEIKTEFGEFTVDFVIFLQNDKYIINEVRKYIPTENGPAPDRTNKFRISPKGLSYLQETRKERRKYWIPIILSNLMAAAALVISILK